MRLNRFDLTRYGRFTNHTFDFGPVAAGAPDLHVIYGPNEAGKSTALAAFLDLLFGIAPKSPFGFLHPYPTMRIGAALDLAGGVREVIRIKRPRNSLLDGAEQPMAETLIQGEIGGIDRDAYRTMFSLDDETLEAGGESILASKGDLGQLLFSTSAGLADVSHTLIGLKAEAEGFYKYRAHGGELLTLKTKLAALKEERERIDTLASDYAQLVETRDRVAAQYDHAIQERASIQAAMEAVQRQLTALPRLIAWRRLRERLAPLADLPDAPAGWAAALPALQSDDIELATRADGVAREIAQIVAARDALVVDTAALHSADRIDRLAGLRARYVTADKDIPERRLQAREVAFAIASLLKRLERDGEADPRRLLLGAATVGALRELIESRSGVAAAVETAAHERAEATRRLDEATAIMQAAAVPGGLAGLAALGVQVAALRRADHAARRRLAERSRETHSDTLADRLRALRPWQGEVAQLVDLIVPASDDILRWSEARAKAAQDIARHAETIETLSATGARLKAELGASERDGVLDMGEAAAIRAAREAAWAHHRSQLDAASAALFETALRTDDIVSTTRLEQARDAAARGQARQALAVAEAALVQAEAGAAAAAGRAAAVDGAVAKALGVMVPDLPSDTPLGKLEAWLALREKALEVYGAVRLAEKEITAADADAALARQALRDALDVAHVPYDPGAGFEALLAVAQAAIERAADYAALGSSVDDRRRDLAARCRDDDKARARDDAWCESWSAAANACWLGEGGSVPRVASVREILSASADLGPALEKQAGLADRIAKMEADQTVFSIEVAALAAELGIDPGGDTVLGLAQLMADRARDARAANAASTARTLSLDEAEARRRTLAEAVVLHEKRKSAMTAFFGVETLSAVAAKMLDLDRKADLAKQEAEAERDILQTLQVPAMAAAEQRLDAADRDALETELAALKARFEDQDQRGRGLFAEHGKALDRLDMVGGDEAVARIEAQRRTVLLEIEDGALRYLRLRVGIVAAEQALRAYRDRHRSSMMAHASDAFKTISRGAYTGLTTQAQRDSEILIAVAAGGASKMAADLSKGTRFQLYLALRMAGYREFAEARRPVPFIADDIMETFDDFRAEETFGMLSEMARIGQVIYLTHHRHLIEIAQRACPTVRIHDLSAAGATA